MDFIRRALNSSAPASVFINLAHYSEVMKVSVSPFLVCLLIFSWTLAPSPPILSASNNPCRTFTMASAPGARSPLVLELALPPALDVVLPDLDSGLAI